VSIPLAGLDMYCWPENRDGWNNLWDAIRLELAKLDISAPQSLTFDRPIEEVWLDPNLLIGHCCGWPYISRLRDRVTLIGRLDFGVAGCPAGFYNSVFIAAKDSDFESLEGLSSRQPTIAVNGRNSQSGFRVLHEVFGKIESSERFNVTGSHRDSIRAVAKGEADLAAIDAVTWDLATAFEPMSSDVKVIGRSAPRPGLPLITANAHSELVPQFFEAVRNGVAVAGEPLGIIDFLHAQESDYEILL